MSWSYKIALVYAGFIVMMSGMVYVASKQTNEMQDENYYVKELKYQDVIDGKNNLNALKKDVKITESNTQINIQIPTETAMNITDGTIYFLRPSDEKKDIHTTLMTDTSGQQLIDKSKFTKGWYTAQISWKSNDKKYFSEQKVFIH
ncbi:MAG: FixH family protein [Chitinophagales bacterium]